MGVASALRDFPGLGTLSPPGRPGLTRQPPAELLCKARLPAGQVATQPAPTQRLELGLPKHCWTMSQALSLQKPPGAGGRGQAAGVLSEGVTGKGTGLSMTAGTRARHRGQQAVPEGPGACRGCVHAGWLARMIPDSGHLSPGHHVGESPGNGPFPSRFTGRAPAQPGGHPCSSRRQSLGTRCVRPPQDGRHAASGSAVLWVAGKRPVLLGGLELRAWPPQSSCPACLGQ